MKLNQGESFLPLVLLPIGAKPLVDVQNVHILRLSLSKKLLFSGMCDQKPFLKDPIDHTSNTWQQESS
ncbi:hypothetical protein EUGRSUZ_I01403 [Eucalyptus grandis]|uniref:Uncharacterized protein n=2 Tax=Eucalyptus grandis TaxID=71139 RepID=A0ACC3JFI0_EUCGR|nr:hypothetical protein EUGRSUZ_I01403 [Eucalyptus grandis]